MYRKGRFRGWPPSEPSGPGGASCPNHEGRRVRPDTLGPDIMLEATPDALAAVDLLFRKFAALLSAHPTDPPDLHFVIVEAPAPGHPRMYQSPPMGAVRPDLQRKALLTHPLDVIPTLPAVRILYYGDTRWLERFLQLGREVAETFRSYDRETERFVTSATWEGEPFFMPNLWPRLVRDISEMSGSKTSMRRWRWGDDLATRMVPYDEADLQAWVEATRERGGQLGPLPSKEVNVTTFTHNAFECSCAALDWSAYQIRCALQPEAGLRPEPDGNRSAPPGAMTAPPVIPPASPTTPLIPSLDQLRAVADALGALFRQVEQSIWLSCCWQQEEHVEPWFVRMADALRPVRSQARSVQGWPHRVGRGLPLVIEAFDEVARDWGWERMADAEPERSNYRTERFRRFEEDANRPRLEAAIAWQEGRPGEGCPPDIDDLADEGRGKGYGPAPVSEGWETHFRSAHHAYLAACRLGRKFPCIDAGSDQRKKLAIGFEALNSALEQLGKGAAAPTASPLAVAPPIPPDPLTPDHNTPATNSRPPASSGQVSNGRTPRRTRERQEAVKLLIEAFRESGQWGITPRQLTEASGTPASSLYRFLKTPSVKKVWDRYRQDSLGKKPARMNEL